MPRFLVHSLLPAIFLFTGCTTAYPEANVTHLRLAGPNLYVEVETLDSILSIAAHMPERRNLHRYTFHYDLTQSDSPLQAIEMLEVPIDNHVDSAYATDRLLFSNDVSIALLSRQANGAWETSRVFEHA